jgi:hypothetical protein
MILDEIKSLIKDFEKCLIKEARFKNDYKFKSQVKTIYSCNKNTPNQIIVPVPYYSGNNSAGNSGVNEGKPSRTVTIQTVPHIDKHELKNLEEDITDLQKAEYIVNNAVDDYFNGDEIVRLEKWSQANEENKKDLEKSVAMSNRERRAYFEKKGVLQKKL